ncbi:MAG: DUF92 domain-containing protein [Candidatus Thermoplasmatota archaeon]|jgi:uncharacterized protein (TIGR00297 family)|nr:DUF92 domain-containing protein [Candidatus Thermoplasmatota archaeon]MCL5983967.1 DUF92 domain-containing protein [Candidatus Thermoplasmatota archaeon]
MLTFLAVALGGGPALLSLIITLVLLTLLAYLAVPLRVLTARGSLAAYLFGLVFLLIGGLPYLFLMVLFVFLGAVATRYHIGEKKKRKVSEGTEGERDIGNVLAHVLLPSGILLISLIPGPYSLGGLTPFLYTSALAFGAADTFASEIGVLGGTPYSILGKGKIPIGTNGGVSLLGELAGFAGAFLLTLFGALAFEIFSTTQGGDFLLWVLLAAIAGWIGCQVDSVLGATAEEKGLLGKNHVNLLAMAFTIPVALGLYLIL